jgi:hypothetical protein
VLPLSSRWWDGFAFYPATGTIAFSDHRLGASLLANPLQWAGASEITAYNLTLLAMFPLCAISAYWLAYTLTRRRDAAFLSGLVYGFSPFRIAHLEHLELAAFGYRRRSRRCTGISTRRRGGSSATRWRWRSGPVGELLRDVLLGRARALMLWFLRWNDRRLAIEIVVASACAVVAVTPIVVGYLRWHARYGSRARSSRSGLQR